MGDDKSCLCSIENISDIHWMLVVFPIGQDGAELDIFFSEDRAKARAEELYNAEIHYNFYKVTGAEWDPNP